MSRQKDDMDKISFGDWVIALICLAALMYYAFVAWALGPFRRR